MDESPTALAGETLHKFLLINRHLRQYARQVNSLGIRPRDFAVLRFLLEAGPATVGQIQEYLYQSPSVASTVVSALQDAGYVTRTRSQEDNRVVIVELTQAGCEVARDTQMGGIPMLRRRLQRLPEERLARINDALADIMDLMEIGEGA